ncbi:hypothetical protein KFK14_15395 [Sphingobium phenoxybenzoativorans]|uniref:Uncharacterized protein n=1 Tax=Sphingobium phenoxybenzoativorans TaxID=1592790 RepID=A0A975K402_9SPHN|nr:hypothetical protein [Sphingobium phenoxybenzoativorans]QUT04439.1 hypothetical protein KFK14_15395 [Sphingobium phenoxybenzoativorans]
MTRPAIPRGHIPTGWLIGILATWLGLSQLLLWRFLNVMPVWAYPLGLLLLGALVWGLIRTTARLPAPEQTGPAPGALLICFAVALLLLILGGEGRFFYSNIDWQVRDAVLRDMAVNPWPFVYTARAVPDVLRAPIGMFFVPALAWKAAGPRAADIALLLQNAALLSILLALGSQLFAHRWQKAAALLILIFFSGPDIVGQYSIWGTVNDRIEIWSGLQYSSNITLAFWVPQHALAGWIAALLFLLWRARRIPLGAFLALLPLTALWSPFGLLGGLPFAALAAFQDLRSRRIVPSDIAIPALATLLVIPTLLYLAAAGDDVGIRFYPIPWIRYAFFEAVEVLPLLVPVLVWAIRQRADIALLLVVAACLVLMPFVQIGWSLDFMMRASIPALTILALLVIHRLFQPGMAPAKLWLVIILLLGSATGIIQIRRALINEPSPRGACTFFKAWDQSFAKFPKGSYLAPLPDMPSWLRPETPARASANEPEKCWPGKWMQTR